MDARKQTDKTSYKRFKVEYPTYLGAKYDASTTNFTYVVAPSNKASEPLEITVSFLSPITPTSTLRQAIPASYVTVHVNGNTGVNIYMDINGRWVSGDANSAISWEHDVIEKDNSNNQHALQRWQIRRQNELLLSEIADRAEWGTLHFTGPAVRVPLFIFRELIALTYPRMPNSNLAMLLV